MESPNQFSVRLGELLKGIDKVSLGYASKDRNIYLSIAGDARVLRDQAKKAEVMGENRILDMTGARKTLRKPAKKAAARRK